MPPLGLQLYTLRDALAADYDGTLARIARIGFGIVEPFDFVSQAEQLREGLRVHGLEARSAHLNFLREGTDLSAAFAAAAELGISTVIEPYVDPARWTSAADIRATADALNAAAPLAAAHGIRIGYHNHWFELDEVEGSTGIEVLAAALDPAVVLELDTYWAAAGGQDVPALLGRLGDRVRFLHVKDGPIEPDPATQTAVGEGRMPVWEILAAAPQVEVGVVELDDFAGDMWSAVESSYRYLSTAQSGAGAR
ncbi:MAG: sugar phosphate isomerase/epimerase [Micrococcales bacterium]|nr:sugar phosphate isomerase/epimerase [Micrococcales bacterium]